MHATPRDDLSLPFLALGLGFAVVVVFGYRYPSVLTIDPQLMLAYGGLFVAFTLAYSYRPIRESRYGTVVGGLFLLLLGLLHYRQGYRGVVLPFGLVGFGLATLCYELYKLGSERVSRRPISR